MTKLLDDFRAPSRAQPDTHQRGAAKLSRIPVKVETVDQPLPKPKWLRVKLSADPNVTRVKGLLRRHGLSSVCEEAACPNLGECFGHGTATFMILGDLCTRRCPFCDVAHGRPAPPDPEEPLNLALAVRELKLRYVVVTSVNRDDLRDGGAAHFAECIAVIREHAPETFVEILTPDFRKQQTKALEILAQHPPEVFNHNLETIPRLYRQARPGADYQLSLNLLRMARKTMPQVATKSGLMLGLGETRDEVIAVMHDLRRHHCEMLTLGQYLQPTRDHLPVQRYIPPEEFDQLAEIAKDLGFKQVASGPLVRSSYHADQQARALLQT
ncbi:MAG: lipoyl synthase [Methylothermaceae bacteria B42]|nr:MAG: lipoyl synthase [Methylothermaceae bacteria B42]HHJ39080.1 lipoyl synthase [Methylothermaceae bacterium]